MGVKFFSNDNRMTQRVFENRVLSVILRSKMEGNNREGWRKLHNEELHSFCYTLNAIRMMNSWNLIED
jgi:hypothetical protein